MNENQNQPGPASGGKNQSLIWALAVGCGCLAILVCGALAGGGAFYYLRARDPTETATPTTVVRPTRVAATETRLPGLPSPATGNTMGDPNAPVTIVEYSDFQCSYCRRFWSDTLPRIVDEYVRTGKVYYIFRSAGNFIGRESGDAAQAAYCAGDQGKFWEYHDILYENQTGENVGAYAYSNLVKFAKALDLDMDAFSDCFKSGRYASRVEQDALDMQADGVQATPSFLINEVLIVGAQPFEAFESVIESALQGR
ncbi:MAG: DsbA family protein [Chloroflexota bacterium]